MAILGRSGNSQKNIKNEETGGLVMARHPHRDSVERQPPLLRGGRPRGRPRPPHRPVGARQAAEVRRAGLAGRAAGGVWHVCGVREVCGIFVAWRYVACVCSVQEV